MTDSTYTVEIAGETHTVDTRSELDARYRAASEYKRELSGPYVGIGVSELAGQATVVSSSAATS